MQNGAIFSIFSSHICTLVLLLKMFFWGTRLHPPPPCGYMPAKCQTEATLHSSPMATVYVPP